MQKNNEIVSSIRCRTDTISLVKEFAKEINAKNLEEAVKLAVYYARNYNGNTLLSQLTLNDKLNSLDGLTKSNSSFIVFLRTEMSKNRVEIAKLKELVNENE